MDYRDLSIAADVGGTFTDCIATWIDQRGVHQSRCIKVLSSGVIRCRVHDLNANGGIRIEVPSELISQASGKSQSNQPEVAREANGQDQTKRLPDQFFRSAKIASIDGGNIKSLGQIASFDSNTSRIEISSSDGPQSMRVEEIRPGQLVEIDCGVEAPVLATRLILGIPIDASLPPMSVRLGTTRGTNALLTRNGARTALVTTLGFGDLLDIGQQDRPELFDLAVQKPWPLTGSIVEIDARMDQSGNELVAVDEAWVTDALWSLRESGIDALAISLLHAYINPDHELTVERIAQEIGFLSISRSSEVAPLIKLVPRTDTTTLDAYLNPLLDVYVQRVRTQFGGGSCELKLMTSGGNLVGSDDFRGRDSVLSGPAGGVVGLEKIVRRTQKHDPIIDSLAIGLDMGGTSTDVSRYDGQVGRRYETQVSGVRVMTPMMDIHTVAAGGGSICDYQGGRLLVGPDSAGASPGPACYGRGGPLCITDVNLLLGRIVEHRFPFPLHADAARERLQIVASRMATDQRNVGAEQAEASSLMNSRLASLAEGFLDIAVTHMAEAVRAITTARGVDVRDHALVGFGGAAAQHLCRVADALGIRRIIDHPRGSVLSAVGIGVASLGAIQVRGVYQPLHHVNADEFQSLCDDLHAETLDALQSEHLPSTKTTQKEQETHCRFEVECRYVGTEAAIELELANLTSLEDRFHQEHENRFGYQRRHHPVELVCVRCEATSRMSDESGFLYDRNTIRSSVSDARNEPSRAQTAQVWHRGTPQMFQCIERDSLVSGDRIAGGALVVSDQSTLVIEPNWQAVVDADGTIILEPQKSDDAIANTTKRRSDDPVQLEIVARRLQSIADAMGEVLRRTAVSVNVKERLDFSCAIFRGDGTLVANAPHVPVHLGAMGHTVRSIAKQFPDMSDGDCYVSNDPYSGGSHLPDVTLVTPVFCSLNGVEEDSTNSNREPDFFVASRAHHAEIGGKTPGSMPPMARCLADEGVLIRAFALVRDGMSYEEDLRTLLSSGPYPSRNVDENIADLRAQIAAGREGASSLKEMVNQASLAHVNAMMAELLNVADESVCRWIQTLPDAPLHFTDHLDDGTPISVKIERRDRSLRIDFAGTADVHEFGFNATESIVSSAVLYVLRSFCDSNLPLCEGVLRHIDLVIPTGLLSPPAFDSPEKCAAVVAGNVETSQRIVDVLLGALGTNHASDAPVFRSVAASQGTMNNLLIGDESFGYYETIGGGSGATVFGAGADAVHTHMTNTRITDPEVIETRLPVRLCRFGIRHGSGGEGKHRGGHGIIREFEFLRPLTVSLITGRRTTRPYGAAGGGPGQSGLNQLTRAGDKPEMLAPSVTLEVSPGDRLRIETPGGGGWGTPKE